MTTDNKFRSMGFSYDANGRVVKATRASTPDATTVYDALGNRVATRVNDVWQYMIYDAFGKLVAEYGVASEGMGGVKYLQQDHQGSVRTVTNSNGFVVARTDHQAFGENVGGGVGLRTTSQGYGADVSTRQSYGLTENDDASGQQHTWFRKLETSAGRFSSPDPYNGSMSLGDPQSFNRYSYTRNEPTNYVDPSGLQQMICMIEGMQTNCSTAFGVINNGGPIRVWSGDGYVSVSARISNEQMGSWYAGGILYRLDSNILLTSHQSQVGIGIVGRVPSIGPPTGPPATTPLPPPEGPCGAIGVDVSVFAGVGAGNGVAATAGVTVAHDVNGHNQSTWVGPHGGAFLGGSGQPGGVGYPSNRGWGIGAAASAGPALFLSNEGSPQDQPGVFSTHIVTIQPLSVAVDRSPSGAVTNVSIGAGVGAGYFTFNTNTGRVRDATTPFRGGCK